MGKNPLASAGLPPVQKIPHAVEERSPWAPLLSPGSRAYEPHLLSLCARESALGNRRGPSGRGPCATARQPPPITATGEEPTHQRRPSAAKKKTSSGKTSLVSLVSFLFYDFLFHSHPPHPTALTSPSPCGLLLGWRVPLSLPPCCFLLWVCQGMSPTSSLQSLRLEQEQALRDTWQAGRQPWLPHLSWDLCPALLPMWDPHMGCDPQPSVDGVFCSL